LWFFNGWAEAKGIKVVTPNESDLFCLTHMYGIEDEPRFLTVHREKMNIVKAQMQNHKDAMRTHELMVEKYQGALELAQYIEDNYDSRSKALPPPAT
jgi:hypothetical protein